MPEKFSKYFVVIGFTCIYLLLPTGNSGIDAYAYASGIRWGHDLIWPHHLLHCLLGRIAYLGINFFIEYRDALALMKIINALAAGISLFLLYRILRELSVFKAHYFVAFCGSCFGWMRYATENEAYILPVLCSLAATLYFIRFLKSSRQSHLILSGLLFGLAALFHQIHIFWYAGFVLAVLIHLKNLKVRNLILFAGSCVLFILFVYFLVFNFYGSQYEGIFQFALHDVYSGQVKTGLGFNNFIMTPISFVRTFIQVHGYMRTLFETNPVLMMVPVAFIIVNLFALTSIIKNKVRQISPYPVLSKALGWAFVLQLAFAFYSVGNAEFMVMLPILAVLWLVLNYGLPVKPVLFAALALLLWNLVFGLSPAYFLDLDGSKQLLTKMNKCPKASWVMSEPQKMENLYDYTYGPKASSGKIFRLPQGDTIQVQLMQSLAKGELLTDCLGKKMNFNRGELVNNSGNHSKTLRLLNPIAMDSFVFFGGKSIIHKLSVE